MITSPRHLIQDALPGEEAWLRRLAMRLVRDPAEAEDLSQETLLTALKAKPEPRTSLRPWLSRVLRNAVRRNARRKARRLQVEAEFRRQTPSCFTEQSVEEAEIHRKVIDAVSSLPEPYRTAVHLRFCEDLTTREIAMRLEVPMETVRTRVKRGLAMLRDMLDTLRDRLDAA